MTTEVLQGKHLIRVAHLPLQSSILMVGSIAVCRPEVVSLCNLLALCTLYVKFSGNLNAAGYFNLSILQGSSL